VSKDIHRINPNPRIVALLDYAIAEIMPRLRYSSFNEDRYGEWLKWAASWKAGQRSPAACVAASHSCDKGEPDPIGHCLGQLAWGAKEACYDVPQSGWLVVRYIADAMVAFGAAFPTKGLAALEPPTFDGDRPGEVIIEATRKLASCRANNRERGWRYDLGSRHASGT